MRSHKFSGDGRQSAKWLSTDDVLSYQQFQTAVSANHMYLQWQQ